MRIEGSLVLDGRPCADQRVHAFASPGSPLLATSVSDSAGAFALDLPADIAQVTLLARFAGAAWGAASRTVEVPTEAPVTISLEGPFPRVSITLHGGSGQALVYLDPLELGGVPEALVPFLQQAEPGVFDAHFFEHVAHGDTLALALAPGRWRIGAHHRPDGPAGIGTPPVAYEAQAAIVSVDRDRDVELSLEPR